MLYDQGRQEELDQLVGYIVDLEAELAAKSNAAPPMTGRSQAPSQAPLPTGRNSVGPKNAPADPAANKKAFFDSRNSAKAIQNRNRGGGNPLSWD